MKKMLAVLLVVALMGCLYLSYQANERPPVSAEAEKLFVEAYGVFSPATKFSSLEEFYQLYGEEKGNQCANCMNYYYDTGKEGGLEGVRRLIKGQSVGAFFVASYTPGSASNKVDVTEPPFPDVPVDAWYAEAVTAMKDSGIITGCDDGLFHPEREIKVGELFAMLLRAGSKPDFDVTKAVGVTNTHWATGVLKNASRVYLYPPKGSGHEDDIVLRGDAVSRVWLLHGYGTKYNSNAVSYKVAWMWTMARERTQGNMTLADIPDYDAVQQFEKDTYFGYDVLYIVNAYNDGIVKGVDAAGTFNPYGTLTRAEVAQMFYNARLTTRIGYFKNSCFQ